MDTNTPNAAQETTAPSTGDPTLQESYDDLVKEGLIVEDGQDDGITDAETATGETDSSSQGELGDAEGDDERPSWLPDKFKSPDDMAKAYAELERKLGSQNKKDDTSTSEDDGDGEAGDQPTAIDFAPFQSEFDETGSLSDDSYAALEKANIPRAMVDAYIEGQTARLEMYEAAVFDTVGGSDAYTALIKWGGNNMTADEIDAFDVAVNSGNLGAAKNAVKGLKARMDVATGTSPQRKIEAKNGGDGASGYASENDMLVDMNNPLYDTSEAFRQQVAAKLARTNRK